MKNNFDLMKLKTSFESPKHLVQEENSQEDIEKATRWLDDKSNKLKIVENNNYEFCNKNEFYFLKQISDGEIVGWIETKKQNIAKKEYMNLWSIYIRPEYRGKNIALMLMFYTKEYLKQDVIIDGALFAGGVKLISKLEKDQRFKLSSINKITGNHQQYQPGDSAKYSLALLVEEHFDWEIGRLPGNPESRISYSFFQDIPQNQFEHV